MVRIRLRRVGGKKQASFRIVAADKESPRDGRFIEILGFYNPRTEPATISLKEDRIYHWISNGAVPSESAEQVFKSAGLLDRFERFKAGESVETLLAEAEAATEARNTNRQTRRPAPPAGSSKRKQAAREAAAVAAAEEAAKAEAAAAAAPAEETPAEAPAAEEAAPAAEAPAAQEAPAAEETPAAEEAAPAEDAAAADTGPEAGGE
ncbi:MAG: 30S ribosomal protein S16 [Anaerolineales bacterium]|nr:30S ribosomal protein S16 [Anaerolineales bacterium]